MVAALHAPGPGPSRLIRLRRREHRLRVHPSAGDDRPFTPFLLPPVTSSLVLWLSTLCETFHERHGGRCLAVMLLLDVRTMAWEPLLPTQSCGVRRSEWVPLASDLDGEPPDRRLAGTFQALAISDLLAVVDAVPSFDGLHVVEQVIHGDRRTLVLPRVGRQAKLAEPDLFITDDAAETLRQYRGRLTLL